MTRRKNSSRFARGLLLYVLIFALLAAAVLTVLYVYLRAYEDSRPASCVRAYLDECAGGKLSYAWGADLAQLDRRYQTEETVRAWIGEKLGTASFRELRSDSAEEKRYGIFDENGVCFETLTLRQNGERRMGFTGWSVAEEDCQIAALTESVDATIPSTYSLLLGGVPVDPVFIAQTGIPYELLEPCTAYIGDLPTMVRYRVGPYLPGPELSILDPAGNEVPEEEQTEAHYLDNCFGQDRERVHQFALRFLNSLLPYAGDLHNNAYAYWLELNEMIVHGGLLEERLLDYMRAGFGYNNTYSIEIVEDEVSLCSDLGSGRYLIDISYRTETVGLEGPVQEDNRTRLLCVEESGELRMMAMFNY